MCLKIGRYLISYPYRLYHLSYSALYTWERPLIWPNRAFPRLMVWKNLLLLDTCHVMETVHLYRILVTCLFPPPPPRPSSRRSVNETGNRNHQCLSRFRIAVVFRRLVYTSQAVKLTCVDDSIGYIEWASARVMGTRWQWPGKHMTSVNQ
jgi:hypothetical protein